MDPLFFTSKSNNFSNEAYNDSTIESNNSSKSSKFNLFKTFTWPTFYKHLFNDSPDGLIIIDNSGTIKLVNKMITSLFGYDIADLDGLTIETLVPPRYKNHIEIRTVYMKTPRNRPMGQHSGIYGLHKDGSEIPLNVGLSPIYIINEQYILISIRDISQQKEVEKISKMNEVFLFNVLESFSSQVAIIDNDFVIIKTNKAWKEFANEYGKTIFERAKIGENLIDIFRKDISSDNTSSQKALDGINLVLNQGLQLFELEYQCRLNAQIKWFLLKVMKFIGQEASLVISHSEITQMINERNSRIEIADRISKIARHLEGVIYQFRLNPDGSSYIPFASDGIEKIFGLKAIDVVNDASPVFKAIHPDDRNLVMQRIQESSISLKPWHACFRVNLPYNKSIWAEGHSAPEKLDDNTFLWHGYIKDITERRMNEEYIIENEKFLSSLFNSINDTILVLSVSDLTVIQTNRAVFGNLGYTSEEVVGQKVKKFFSDESDYSTFYKTLNNSIQYQTTLIKSEHKLVRKDGVDIICQIQITFLLKGDKYNQVIMTLHDVTDFNIMFHELINAKNKAEENEKLKSSFLANISHEIRTPLNGIIGFTELLKDLNISIEERKEYVEILSQSGQRMLSTIHNLIDMSKIEAGIVETIKDVINVTQMMDAIFAFFKPEILKKGIDFRMNNIFHNQSYTISSDRNKIESILNNLLTNAIKFTSQGFIEFGTKIEDERIFFYVKDSGIGIPQNKIDIIFNPFVQADLSVSRGYEGSGLGLSISKSYAEIIGGKIVVQSEPGKGSSFSLLLPTEITKTESKTYQNNPKSFTGRNLDKTILIVEDDPINFTLTEIILKKNKINSITAINGTKAMKIFKETPNIDLILMDIKLPDISGCDVTKEIRKLNTSIPIIAFTAYAFPVDFEKMLEAGCNEYLTKPFLESDLLRMINKYLA
jgi:PAS domain S-box-containing protein